MIIFKAAFLKNCKSLMDKLKCRITDKLKCRIMKEDAFTVAKIKMNISTSQKGQNKSISIHE